MSHIRSEWCSVPFFHGGRLTVAHDDSREQMTLHVIYLDVRWILQWAQAKRQAALGFEPPHLSFPSSNRKMGTSGADVVAQRARSVAILATQLAHCRPIESLPVSHALVGVKSSVLEQSEQEYQGRGLVPAFPLQNIEFCAFFVDGTERPLVPNPGDHIALMPGIGGASMQTAMLDASLGR